MSTTVRVLGLDPGTATTGYGVVETGDSAPTMTECGAIRTPSEDSPARRLDAIYRSVRQLCRTHEPGVLAVEQLFFNRNVKSAMSVAQARGTILLAGQHYRDERDGSVRIESYNPSTVKQALTGHGGADKQAVKTIVQQELNLSGTPEPSDAADALALALCHLFEDRFPSGDETLPG